MQKIGNPVPFFFDTRGQALTGGSVYYGVANADPETTPVSVFLDEALSVPIDQPIRTIGGMAVNGTSPVFLFIAEADFSMKVLDENGVQVLYSPSVFTDTSAFQPIDADLTAIAAQGTTAYGRGFLALANQAALQALLGTLPYLSRNGGTVQGPIIGGSAGAYLFWTDPLQTSGRRWLFPVGAADPPDFGNPGDTIEYFNP